MQFLEAWATVIEIARFPALASRLHSAEYVAQVLNRDDPAWREAMAEIRAVHAMARELLGPAGGAEDARRGASAVAQVAWMS
ncbi:hypothetical protein [Streptomyces sp. NPDC050485]|uniref:hypothetical protein n=1 Tax=Streptomyces sp. NPDC050485 TaxID=3365617 RepID=UPI0037AEAFA1